MDGDTIYSADDMTNMAESMEDLQLILNSIRNKSLDGNLVSISLT